ncbi:DUF1294 domain-containing protein [Rahnella bonaserana]|jgi:uncharacterized membrane protein YsdA (DUF1294 family)|uniref:DUF1294 domain-containing protein n=1 Tax=Rahnella bonaserana TaxID=2816248 RepID=A0ABS6LZ95_9GAMM|nr:DUF1294 domain-containing protein [Rahnella bonaserana]MBU9856928.1 DUF1294 domain-containing protein [Rahnella bonaserana]MCL9642856.1 DUF1294 domain-containing protein [Rahnella victoriana]
MNFRNLSYLLLIAAAAGSACSPHPFVMWFLIINLLTLVFYGVDKRAACNATSRVPEFTLLLLGFAGGWIGAIFGQQLFRHKTKKQPFRTWFAISVILNLLIVAGAGWLMRDLFL